MSSHDVISTLNTELRPILGDRENGVSLIHRSGRFILQRQNPLSAEAMHVVAVGETLEELVHNYDGRRR